MNMNQITKAGYLEIPNGLDFILEIKNDKYYVSCPNLDIIVYADNEKKAIKLLKKSILFKHMLYEECDKFLSEESKEFFKNETKINKFLYQIHKFKRKFLNLFDDIFDFYFDIKYGIQNFWKFRKVIWKYRWWDYEYFYDILDKFFEDWLDHYGIETHFQGDQFTRGRLIILKKWFNQMRTLQNSPDAYREYKKLRDKFWYHFGRLIPRLWD